ncbi:hypothetical protein NIE79_005011 [Micromonospora sp. NIE79]|uniref:Uncharacterized protein n=1 Tax=Micromonospora trifolii TaxID=2911208 RepID=A0ABS9MX37_9ACTN|nr:hypothetical protein [Micromonospora trifolii]MCG5441955.1 hypothetical protein [Micromonospora trifolii]
MPTVVVLALTLALAPAPSASATSNPLGDIVGGVGQIVDDLLGGDTPSAAPTPSLTPTGAATPSRPPVAGRPSPAEPTAIPRPAGSAGGAPAPAAPDRRTAGEGTGTREATVPWRDGDTPAPTAPPALANPTRNAWPPVSYLLVVAVLAVLGLLLLRRRAPVPAAAPDPDPVPDSGPAPDPGPVPENVSRLPTSLNAIYEMGRQDERLEQERRRRT